MVEVGFLGRLHYDGGHEGAACDSREGVAVTFSNFSILARIEKCN
jgi:hypothetical protein